MREILFRGKRINNGEWVEGYYMKHINRTLLPINDSVEEKDVEHIIFYDAFSDWNMPRGIEGTHIDPATLGQYTGLKDKNGKWIFEGDILRWTRKNIRLIGHYAYDLHMGYNYGDVLQVVSNRAGFMLAGLKDDMLDVPNANTKVDNYAFWNYQGSLEVIGNVWDNPELLEVD